ncbi:glycosyl hydrolase family 28-related protein [Sphingomonas morindae]|uniref:SMP-30/gluconolactonase/LRE family protein n=1 Tax=Sphingomonas morindae TaxID=1541170 RepID=A0ABY4X509_9SPHN|nr:glycosyl hydrolase family 28-related protein [Sphingomonas morindae]USI71974.1 SMP-30/gluconolactonase/LRE family protein [Sphingomonas morindae]
MRSALLATTLALGASAAWAAPEARSSLATMPVDARAVTVRGAGDGRADDSEAIQSAIAAARGPTGEGIVFLPSGRYRITRSILIPQGVRLFGTGRTRPVLVLAPRTPGFDTGVKTMVVFTGGDQYEVGKVPVPVPTLVPASDTVRDANSATFYSAMSNIDIEIGEGNPAAAGVRFRVAQHAYLSHMDFRLGSAFAGIYQAGNVAQDLHFHGGRYGIVSEKTSPAWQFTLLDSSFDGQRDAAIREHEVDLTLVNVRMADAPVGIEIDQGYSDSLWGKDVRFARIAKAGIIISNENNAFTQIGFDNAMAEATPVFARFRESGKTLDAPGQAYRVADFSYGLTLPGTGAMGRFETRFSPTPIARMPAPAAPAIKPLPPVSQWVDVRTLGVKGDGHSDDTAALQRAIDAHRILYFPVGFYMISDTLRLRPDSVLIGLHPSLTQIQLPDRSPAYAGFGGPKPMLETAKGGSTMVSGLGLFGGRINPRVTPLLWKAGAASQIDDVKIQGGGGTFIADGKPLGLYARPGGDFVANTYMDAQYPGLWVTDGGGGTFVDIWAPNTQAQNGLYVSNTKTPGHVYEFSNEHHVRNEIVLDGVENWEFLAPQTEQEVGEGGDAVSLEVRNSRNILFANYHAYRVTRNYKPALTAAKLYNVSDIRFRNVHVNAESGYATCDANGCGTYLRASKFPFENAILDVTHKQEVREREFARLDVAASPPPPLAGAAADPAGAGVERLEDGFWSISGAAVDKEGRLYFVDHRFQRIYRWSEAGRLEVVADHPIDPVNLAVDGQGNLLILSSLGAEGSVYSLKPGTTDGTITPIAATPARPHAGARTLLPVNWWNNGEFRDQYDPATDHFTTLAEMFARDVAAPKAREYVSPDGSLVLPAFRVFQQGPADHVGWRFSDTLQSYGFTAARPGDRVFVSNESEDRTYSARLGAGGSLTDLKVFANRGGESVAVGPDGKVYVANGQIFVYAPDGAEIGRIDVPERPLQLIFGGADKHTLFILAHHALFATRR